MYVCTSCAEVPGKSGKSDSNSTHEQLTCAVNHESLVSWRSKSFHKCHACHAKRASMSPSATPATQSEGRCHQVPHLPRKVKVDVTKCHACHAKLRSMPPSATPATQSEGQCRQVPRLPRPRRQLGPKRATRASPVPEVPRLPRKVKVDVTKCHACHTK